MGSQRPGVIPAGIVGAAGLALTAACSRPDDNASTASGAVTITHASARWCCPLRRTGSSARGLTEQDDLLAVGVAGRGDQLVR